MTNSIAMKGRMLTFVRVNGMLKQNKPDLGIQKARLIPLRDWEPDYLGALFQLLRGHVRQVTLKSRDRDRCRRRRQGDLLLAIGPYLRPVIDHGGITFAEASPRPENSKESVL